MFGTLLSTLRNQSGNDEVVSKRRYPRRSSDKCVSVINGRTYPVENWSMGGLLVFADSRPFGVDNEIDVTMRFKLRSDIVNIPHRARVVRKSKEKVALEFMPLTEQIRRKFQNVVDDFVTGQFADSQLS